MLGKKKGPHVLEKEHGGKVAVVVKLLIYHVFVTREKLSIPLSKILSIIATRYVNVLKKGKTMEMKKEPHVIKIWRDNGGTVAVVVVYHVSVIEGKLPVSQMLILIAKRDAMGNEKKLCMYYAKNVFFLL